MILLTLEIERGQESNGSQSVKREQLSQPHSQRSTISLCVYIGARQLGLRVRSM